MILRQGLRTAARTKPKPISTITAADVLAVADRLARAGTSRKPLDRSDVRSDVLLAARFIRAVAANAQSFDRFALFDDEGDEENNV